MRRPLVGPMLLVIGTLHLLLGLVAGWETFAGMVRDGLLGTLGAGSGPQPDREAAFWFEVTGVAMLLLGAFTSWVERRLGELPALLGWGLAGIAVVGIAISPVSGFWALLAPAVVVLRRAYRSAGAAVGTS